MIYISWVTQPLRKCGTPPKLSNSEAIAIAMTGGWLDLHSNKDIWKYFKQHWSHLFPKLPDRSQLVRQTANLSVVKQQVHQYLAKLLGADTADIHLVDGFPMDVCVTTRAKNSSVYKSEAAYGYCAAKKKSFHGFQGHLMTDARGVPVAMTIIAANIDKRIRTRDTWHLTSCIARKLLRFTVGIYLNIQAGNEPMQFEGLITT